MLSHEALGERLKLAREQTGMNQTEAAGALRITAAALSHYESGKRKVEALTLESLSRLYGVALGYFFGEDEPRADWEVALRSLAQNLSPQGKAGISHLRSAVTQPRGTVPIDRDCPPRYASPTLSLFGRGTLQQLRGS